MARAAGQRKGAGGTKRRTSSSSGRLVVLFVLMTVLLAVVGGRLFFIQVVEARVLTVKAEKQRTRDLTLPARRGSIFDRNGQPLAVTTDAKTVYAVPTQIKDATATASAIARALGGSRADYLTRLHHKGSFVYIARKVDLAKASALEKLGIDGVGFLDDSKRSYPGGELAAQILGFVGVDDEGLAGIEKEYDSTLAGTPGRMVAERDPRGDIIPGGIVAAQDAVDGQDVYLTIDKDIQYEAQTELAAAVKKFSAKSGSVLVMDPRSGEILAMASTPYFDPNHFGQAEPDAMRNKAITDAYEPGSTIKSFTAAAAIDQSVFTPASMFHLPPTITVGGHVIHDAESRGTVDWSLAQIVTNSSNVGAVKIGQALGKTRLADYFARFGLSHRTGVDFPGEASGWTPPPSTWSATSMGNLPFGQGLSVTPLQLARGLAAIANGGTLVTPHFLYQQGSVAATFPASPERVISAAAAKATTIMLTDVVKFGTGVAAAVPGYEVAGKTGTAQKPALGGGGYMKGVYVASFAGFLPAGNPKLLIVVTLDSPKSGMFGGTVAAPTFATLAQFCIGHLRIPPTPLLSPMKKPSATTKKTSGTTRKQGNGKVATPTEGRDDGTPMLESTSPVR
jgi:cell division protein FtsI (penicillin-binding protein 3)